MRKLITRLTVGTHSVIFNDFDIRLELRSPGRASFVVASNELLSGVVAFDAGYDKENLVPFFKGYIDGRPNRVDEISQRIFCREFSAVLSLLMPLALRNVFLSDVLQAISTRTGLAISSNGDASYSKRKTPFYYSVGTGYHCMDALAPIFDMPQPLWQQQGDGGLFVGSWGDSFWSSKEDLPIPEKLFTNHGVANTVRMPLIPTLRPGARLLDRGYVTAVTLKNDDATIQWSSNPWAK